jgi:hypothetical protein
MLGRFRYKLEKLRFVYVREFRPFLKVSVTCYSSRIQVVINYTDSLSTAYFNTCGEGGE